jgi:hypothetical protein
MQKFLNYVGTYNPAVFLALCGLTLVAHFVVTVIFG